MPKTLVALKGVHKFYGDTEVLHDVSLAIDDGEFLTILGPSGSGKTTILRLIGGFIEPTRGAIILDGRDISGLPINRRPFNTVFQDYALFPHMTVADNVGYGLMVRGVAKAEIRERVRYNLELVALGDFASRYPAQLSGGQQQRVALARAIICQPRLILLDEPLGALDAGLRHQMQRFLKRLQREIRTTFLFITHDQEEAITMSDRIAVMREGRIVQTGTPKEVYYRPQSEYVARFFGDNNLIEGNLGPDGRAGQAIDTPLGRFFFATGTGPGPDGGATSRPAKLVVRPEAIRIDAGGIEVANRMAVRVEEIDFIGPVSHVLVRALAHPETVLMIKLTSRSGGLPVEVGREVVIGWSSADCHMVDV